MSPGLGWFPFSWSPSGDRLLVGNAKRQLGLWSPAAPRSVAVIGTTAKKVAIGQIMWLPKPAKLRKPPKSAKASVSWYS